MMPTYFKRRFPRLLISFIFILFITEFALADEITEPLPYKNFIEQNKTWWYRDAVEKRYTYDPYYFGIKIEGDTIIDDIQWSKCWLIDVEKNKILPCPIALIREEDKKIYKYSDDEWLEQAKKDYLNNSNNNDIYFRHLVDNWMLPAKEIFSFGCAPDYYVYEDYISSPKDYPLYDFYTDKKKYDWPWSYLCYEMFSREFEVVRLIEDQDGRPFQAHRMLREYEEMNKEPTEERIKDEENEEFLIIEGVGIHRLRAVNGCSTFIWPADVRLELISWRFIPELLIVTLNDDAEVYFRSKDGRDFSLNEAVHKNEIIETPIEAPVKYDLMGREVKNPVPGSIYISGGKKMVWR